ncbi:unnamed protein product [Amoebophrya sp. A25]|nr:unnamed protein product [Amoebophrya sp. A25]|eukprot:GSA25T00020309001.1
MTKYKMAAVNNKNMIESGRADHGCDARAKRRRLEQEAAEDDISGLYTAREQKEMPLVQQMERLLGHHRKGSGGSASWTSPRSSSTESSGMNSSTSADLIEGSPSNKRDPCKKPSRLCRTSPSASCRQALSILKHMAKEAVPLRTKIPFHKPVWVADEAPNVRLNGLYLALEGAFKTIHTMGDETCAHESSDEHNPEDIKRASSSRDQPLDEVPSPSRRRQRTSAKREETEDDVEETLSSSLRSSPLRRSLDQELMNDENVELRACVTIARRLAITVLETERRELVWNRRGPEFVRAWKQRIEEVEATAPLNLSYNPFRVVARPKP